MLSAIILSKRNYLALPINLLFFKFNLSTTNTSEVYLSRSSRTRVRITHFLKTIEDRNQTVSRRSKPNSRTTLIGEQPNPWNLLQLQDVMSRHRGAKQLRR